MGIVIASNGVEALTDAQTQFSTRILTALRQLPPKVRDTGSASKATPYRNRRLVGRSIDLQTGLSAGYNHHCSSVSAQPMNFSNPYVTPRKMTANTNHRNRSNVPVNAMTLKM